MSLLPLDFHFRWRPRAFVAVDKEAWQPIYTYAVHAFTCIGTICTISMLIKAVAIFTSPSANRMSINWLLMRDAFNPLSCSKTLVLNFDQAATE